MKCEKQWQKHLEFVVPAEVYLILTDRLSLLVNPIKEVTCDKTGISQRPLCWPSTPNPPTRKMFGNRYWKVKKKSHGRNS